MTKTVLRYTGDGFIIGVPARDLTTEEAKQYTTLIEEQQALTGIRMYEPVNPEPAKTAARKSVQDEGPAPAAPATEGGN